MKKIKFFELIFFLGPIVFTCGLASYGQSQKAIDKAVNRNATVSLKTDVDIIIISNNCPIKLYACLESIKSYVKGYNKIFVLYSASDSKFEEAYKDVNCDFKDITMLRYVTDGNDSNLKPMLFHFLHKDAKGKYFSMATDDIIVKDFVDLKDCVYAIEKYDAFGFSLILGKNITKDSAISFKNAKQIEGDIISWKIYDSAKEFSGVFDMVVYNRSAVLKEFFRKLNCQKTKDLKIAWSNALDISSNMVCFYKSKAIKLTPIVFQNELSATEPEKNFLEYKLLRIFNSGFKIKINAFYGIDNSSSDILHEVAFIPRNDENVGLWEELKDKQTEKDKHFVFVIASYNNKQWYKPNLDSVFSQKYKNYNVIYVDDNSPDDTGKLVDQYIKERKLEDKILLIKNEERLGAVANIYRAIHMCNDKDIIITLDGDDWLANDHVLELLNKVYDDPNIWLTYGQFIKYPGGNVGFCKEFPSDVILNRDFRKHKWIASHLRSFYSWLFKKIKIEDLMYEGKFFSMAWDLAIMFPMFEMSGNRFVFIKDILYVYNFDTPFNDFKIDREWQFKLDKYIRSLTPYEQLI